MALCIEPRLDPVFIRLGRRQVRMMKSSSNNKKRRCHNKTQEYKQQFLPKIFQALDNFLILFR